LANVKVNNATEDSSKPHMDVTLLILAGGGSRRFGLLNTILPKSAMPIYDECTLARNVRQARAAGFKKIIVSTRASFRKPLCHILEAAELTVPDGSVTVVTNRHHRNGALPALLHLLNNVEAPRVALCLSDIFFIEDAYRHLYDYSHSDDNCMGTAEPFDPNELSKGGIVICDEEQRIQSVLEAPIDGNRNGTRWSGLAVFGRDVKSHLEAFVAGHGGASPIGDFFEDYRAQGNELRAFEVPDFINVNTPDDMFLASMYRAMELHDARDAFGDEFSSVTTRFRKRLLRGTQAKPNSDAREVERLTSKA
jgi:NDP-sugar pyrophosphorylase family protein